MPTTVKRVPSEPQNSMMFIEVVAMFGFASFLVPRRSVLVQFGNHVGRLLESKRNPS